LRWLALSLLELVPVPVPGVGARQKQKASSIQAQTSVQTNWEKDVKKSKPGKKRPTDYLFYCSFFMAFLIVSRQGQKKSRNIYFQQKIQLPSFSGDFPCIFLFVKESSTFSRRELRYSIRSGVSILEARGRQQNNNRRPPWWVGGSAAKKGPGSDFFRFCFSVFLNSPHREMPKNVIKKHRETIGFGFFDTISFEKHLFCGVFELPSLRNTRNRDKTTDIDISVDLFWKKLKSFRHGLFAKICLWCF
jgi:hypothetical protein